MVETVAEASPAREAGMRPGDLLLRWERAAAPPANPASAAGDFASPFDVMAVAVEQAPRGPLRILGRRGEEPVSFAPRTAAYPSPGAWGLTVRPALAAADLERYLEAREALEAGRLEEGLRAWGGLADDLEAAGDLGAALWLRYRVGRAALEADRAETARAVLAEAAERAEAEAMADAATFLWEALAEAAEDMEAATRSLERGLAVAVATDASSLRVASLHAAMGRPAATLEIAREHHARALALRERLAPDSLVLAESLVHLGWTLMNLGDVAAAAAPIERGVAIAERLAADSLELAHALYRRGALAIWTDRFAEAAEDFERALELARRRDLQGKLVGWALTGLGLAASYRGDLAGAETAYRQGLERATRSDPGGSTEQALHINLGLLGLVRGDEAEAEEHYRRVVEQQERRGDEPSFHAEALEGLGTIARRRGDLQAAEQLYLRAAAIIEADAPASEQACGSQELLAGISLDRGELSLAEARLRRALEICEAIQPGSTTTADILVRLAEIARRTGRMEEARIDLERAVAIEGRLAPGTLDAAEAAHALGMLHRQAGRRDEALRYLREAVESLEVQSGRLGGSEEVRANFRARHAHLYQDLVDLLIEMGQPGAAFDALEQGRARVFLALLVERELSFARDLPEDLERRRREVDARYDGAVAELARLAEGDEEAQAEVRARLEALRRERREVRDAVRAAAPRLAALQDPAPLGLAAVRAALDPGTLLLSFAVGPERSHLFAVGPGPEDFRVVDLAAGAAALRERVEVLRAAIAQRARRVEATSDELGRLLLGPVAEAVSRAERLLVVPDGPLHLLPFAALRDPGRPGRYLVEAKPVVLAASATVFAELERDRRAETAVLLAAFGDPAYPAETPSAASQVELQRHLRRGARLHPLPATRLEVERLRDLYGDAAAVYLGPEATEERAKAIGAGFRLVHFASHALLDETFPLESALVLTIPEETTGRENGLLQAWEIFESLRLDADLVALSACETALGREVAGEGMLGLTRAFHYAGARSVLASLWRIEDASTAELMRVLYAGLRAGLPKDEALRRAQVRLLRQPLRLARDGVELERDASHPYYWAAFQLFGDWR